MARLFLAVWIAAFAAQSADIPALVAPDDCTEQTRGSANDPCPDACPRCVCCARVALSLPHLAQPIDTEIVERAVIVESIDPATTPSPHGVFHVPKNPSV